MTPDLKSLRTFVAVLDCGSVIAASRRQGYAASAVSRQMASLQARLGVRLFEPHGRGIAPTEEAFELAELARNLLAAADSFERSSRNFPSRANGRRAARDAGAQGIEPDHRSSSSTEWASC